MLHVARGHAGPKKIAKNSSSGHHRTTLSGYIFATKACVDNRKKCLTSISRPQYGELRPTNGRERLASLGTPANFNGVHVLASLLLRLRSASSRFELSRHVEIARTCSKLVADRFEAKFHYAIWFEPVCNQLRTR